MKRSLIAISMIFFLLTNASGEIKVVATLPWIGSIAREIGKEKIDLTVLVKPSQDPHYVEAKPGMILAVRKADVIIYNGLDLEIGYLPRIVESSNNPKIQPGRRGNVDCSRWIEPIEKPLTVDRSMGDVHPLGNPHYHFSSQNIIKVAEGITGVFSEIDADNALFYKDNLLVFKTRLKEKQKQWHSKHLEGKKFIAYHKLFEYIAQEYGFHIIGYIEPKPGIPPSAGHIAEMIEAIKKTKPDGILTSTIYGKKEAGYISEKTGIKLILLPHDVGAIEGVKDWFSLMDTVISALE